MGLRRLPSTGVFVRTPTAYLKQQSADGVFHSAKFLRAAANIIINSITWGKTSSGDTWRLIHDELNEMAALASKKKSGHGDCVLDSLIDNGNGKFNLEAEGEAK